jgi:hypothetical protein
MRTLRNYLVGAPLVVVVGHWIFHLIARFVGCTNTCLFETLIFHFPSKRVLASNSGSICCQLTRQHDAIAAGSRFASAVDVRWTKTAAVESLPPPQTAIGPVLCKETVSDVDAGHSRRKRHDTAA